MRARPLLSLLALVAVAGPLSACGGADDPSPPGSAQNPLPAEPAAIEAAGAAPTERSNEAAAAPGHAEAEAKAEVEAEPPGYQSLVEEQAAKPRKRFTPCNLVTRAQARAIVGEPLRTPLEAPQGPTCIYRSEQGDAFVTLAIQALDFKRLRRQIDKPQQVDVASRSAYCGDYGQPTLYLPLPGGRVLSVGAPCKVAREFAAAALPRLDA